MYKIEELSLQYSYYYGPHNRVRNSCIGANEHTRSENDQQNYNIRADLCPLSSLPPPKPTTEPWEQMPALLVVWLQHTVMICLTDHAWLMFADTTWLVAS